MRGNGTYAFLAVGDSEKGSWECQLKEREEMEERKGN